MEINTGSWIDKLFSEATFEPERMVGGMYHPYIPLQRAGESMRLSVTRAQYHKFAQLIIQECVKICEQNGLDVDNGDVFRSDPQRAQSYQERWSTGSHECAQLIQGWLTQQQLVEKQQHD